MTVSPLQALIDAQHAVIGQIQTAIAAETDANLIRNWLNSCQVAITQLQALYQIQRENDAPPS